jgi:anti-anti-sigma factor
MSPFPHRPCAEAPAEDATVVRFTGARVSLDDNTIYLARDSLFAIAAEQNRSPLLLDFGNVHSVSSAALGTLVALHRGLLAAGRRLTFRNLNPEVYEVFAVTRLDRLLDLRPAEPDGPVAEDARPPGVLVADDEPALRVLLGTALGRAGLRVWSAADGAEAVELYRANPGEIGVALLDVAMPRMDGPHALAALRKLCPAVCCCFMTGGPGPYSEEALLAAGAARVFRKPFVLDEITRTIRVLAESAPRAAEERWIELPLRGA